MAVDRSKQRRVSAAPPPPNFRVNKFVEPRSAELEALHSIVADRSNNDFRSRRNKRRRTTSYKNRVANNRYRKRLKLGLGGVGLGDDVVPEKDQGEKAVSRRIRRRIELKKNPESGYSTSGDGTKRLRTHVWHAKRFTMTKQWGFHLPLVLQGRGRGSRALLKRFKDGVLVHDASYCGAIQLEGPESSLLQMLSTVLVYSQPSPSENISHFVLSGALYGNAMVGNHVAFSPISLFMKLSAISSSFLQLHHSGAPFSPAVAPVTYIWRPFQRYDMVDADYRSADGYDGRQRIEGSSFRQLLVWIHASSFSEAYDVLKLACQKQMDETGSSINCISLQGKLAKLEIMGSKSFQLLQKILHPVTSIADNSGQLRKCSLIGSDTETHSKKISILENEHHTPTVTSLTVIDPRALSEEKVEHVHKADSTSKLGNMREDEGKKLSVSGGIPSKDTELLSSSLLELEEGIALSDSMDLWDASKGILPPVEDNVLCTEKHQQKLDFFCLGNTNLGKQNASSGGLFCRFCPVLLANDSNRRWSIILPLSWVKVFWVPLISGGAHAIGLTEKHWISSEVGLPYFPSGFPDCNAYSTFMANKAAVSDEKLKLRPPAMRPIRIPIPSPWEIVRFSVEEESSRVKDAEPLSEEQCFINGIDQNSFKESDCQRSDVLALGQGFMSDGFVARTSNMLRHFLREIRGDHLLLFPESDLPGLKNSICKFMKDDERLSRTPKGATTLSNSGRRLCFLRVILHAYKGGVLEEGAAVCAPRNTDIELWTSRLSNDRVDLQIPQSTVGSYFLQQPTGKWEVQIPEDPTAKESHRWPLGFVTSGFVRGSSKKPSAEAVCEATLLAGLREEQWNAMPVKRRRKEIYVLVRNLRSTAYRLALATIVLEQNKEDLEFM